MIRESLTLLAAVLFVGTLAISPASAQDAAGDGEQAGGETDRARALFLRGDRLYAQGQYDEAVDAFQEAYDISGRVALKFNLANAFERLNRLEEALAALREYAPHAEEHQRSLILTRIENLEQRLAAEDEARRGDETSGTTGGTATGSTGTSGGSTSTGASDEGSGASGGQIAGYAMMGVGGALIIGGVIAGVMANSAGSEAEEMCMNGFCPESAQDSVDQQKSRALAADILFAAGGAIAVTGLVLALVLRPSDDDDESDTAFSVTPTRNGVHASFMSRF